MGARLKLCLMSHIEDNVVWGGDPSKGYKDDPNAVALGTLAHAIASGGRGAKLSVQVDVKWLDQNAGLYPGGPTSLSSVLLNGGNLWLHTHSATAAHLPSTWMTVASAYASEMGVGIDVGTSQTAGRSGGADMDDPSLDWVSIAVATGIRRMNSTVVNYYACTPESLRPYRMTAQDMRGLYYHDAAPGPLYDGAPTTMRQRPFWVNSASQWDAHLTSTLPDELDQGSLLMIPHPARVQLGGLAEGRSAYPGSTGDITVDDLDAALTEVWSTYKQMEDYQHSISNVWYIHVRPQSIRQGLGVSPVVNSIAAWVDSVNALLHVPDSAVWMNMNEITSWFWDGTSRYF